MLQNATGIDVDFKAIIADFCDDIQVSADIENELPDGLNDVELAYVREACTERGFSFESKGEGENIKYFVCKRK